MAFNFDDLKASLLLSDTQRDERVEVNQRHLIDKILARYSSEFTIYREVVQNSDDAGATEFSIEFKCDDAQNVVALSFTNNGKPFSKEDWLRLKRIAEGNPDESKIGFFGVGFYSLFSVCDEPIVCSGDTCLGFNWKGDQLYTRTKSLDTKIDQTCIYLELRQPIQVPDLDEFSEFAGKCLLFTRSLRKFSVNVNGVLQFCLFKRENGKVSIPNSSPSNRSFSSANIFKADDTIFKSDFLLSYEKNYTSKAKKDNFLGRFWKTVMSKPSSSESHSHCGTWEIGFSLWNLNIFSEADKKFQSMFERVTKKSPSKKSTLSILMPDLANTDKLAHPILKSIVPLESQGKLFIGFETHQTSSAVFHVNGPFIPTVERESLDFVDPTLATWNQDMLVHCGHLLRVLYDHVIEERYTSSYFFKTFAFELSTPSQIPSSIICDSFFTSINTPLRIPTTKGVAICHKVRIVPDDMSSFLKSTPTIYKDDSRWNKVFWENAAHYIKFETAGAEDLLGELKRRQIFNEAETIAMLNWLCAHVTNISSGMAKDLFQLMMVPVSDLGKEMKPLSTVAFFPTALTRSLPHLPSNCISPHVWEKCAGLNRLRQLKPLNVIDWFRANASSERFRSDPAFIEEMFASLSSHFQRLNPNEVETVKNTCRDIPCIPTTKGLALPSFSFFETVKVLVNLPIVNFVARWKISDDMLRALGVKSHLPIPDIMANLKDWDYQSLVKYLVDVQEDLSDSELKILATFPIYSDTSGKLKRINELYLSNEITKFLKLPILRWSPDLREDDRITEFLFSLGLNTAPSLDLLLGSIKSASFDSQRLLIGYFYRNFARHYFDAYNGKTFDIECVPTSDQKLVKPSNCYTDNRVQAFGFKVIHPGFKQYSATFQLEQKPSASALVDKLASVSFQPEDANVVLALLGSAQHEFSRSHWKVIKETNFIPVGNGQWRRPDQVFFRCENHELGYLFHQVDFGPSGNAFLHAAGVQEKPSIWSVAQMLINDPDGILKQIGAKSYLHLLKTMALDLHSLMVESPSSFAKIKSRRFLLGIRHLVKSEEDTAENEFVVADTSEIFLVDDSISAQLFDLLSAPPGDAFVDFYREMGCLKVSDVIEEKWFFSGEKTLSDTSMELQKRIQQRAHFLCHGMKAEQRDVLQSAESALNNINVFEIALVTVSRSFRGLVKERESTACFASDGSVLITRDFDYFDVAALLAKLIFTEPKMSDSLLLSSFLSMSLKHLQSKGFGLDLFAEPDFTSDPHSPPEMSKHTEVDRPLSPLTQPEPLNVYPIQNQMQELVENEPELHRQSQRKNRRSLADFFEKFKSAIGGDTQKFKSGSQDYDHDAIQKKLAESSRACGEVDQTEFDLAIRGDDRPTIAAPEVSHCAIPESRLQLIANVDTVKLFTESSMNQKQQEALLKNNVRDIHSFVELLCTLGKAFDLNQSQINVFYIPNSTIMAFNRSGCLFFSLDSFLSQQQQRLSRRSIMASWFVTFAHELAHNFSRNHDLIHGQYMSLYIEHYMEEIHKLFIRLEK